MGSSAPFSYVNLATLLGDPDAWIDEEFWQRQCELRVAVPAVVTEFDDVHQTVTVQATVQEMFLRNGVPTPVSIPALPNVPVMAYRAGGFVMTFPISVGDECLVVFADMSIDAWWQSGGTQNKQIKRHRHDLSDGFAVFGIWNQKRLVTDWSNTAVQIRDDAGDTIIELGENEVKVTATNITMTGATKIVGTLEVTQAVTCDETLAVDGGSTLTGTVGGTGFRAHEHTGVTTGGGDTGGVV